MLLPYLGTVVLQLAAVVFLLDVYFCHCSIDSTSAAVPLDPLGITLLAVHVADGTATSGLIVVALAVTRSALAL